MVDNQSFTVSDMFAGCGGSSTGIVKAGAEVVFAGNHWALAIESHNANHPNVDHDIADITGVHPSRWPKTSMLWASPECTNHSVAKGVKRAKRQLSLFDSNNVDPSAERSRATAFDVVRFAEYWNYPFVVVENVVDFRDWKLFDAWLLMMRNLGYEHHIIYFNSMFAHLDPKQVFNQLDYVAQSRDRMYVVFWKSGNKKPDLEFRPLAFCQNCGCDVEAQQVFKDTKKVKQFGGRWGSYGVKQGQYYYACPRCSSPKKMTVLEPYHFAAWNIIDPSVPITKIGERESRKMKPLKDSTIKRIKQGIEKFGDQYLMIDLAYTHADNTRARPLLGGPSFTQTTRQTFGVVSPSAVGSPMIIKFRKNADATEIHKPVSTISAGGIHHGLLVDSSFLMSYYGSGANVRMLDRAAGAFTTKDRHALVHMPFILGYANGKSKARDVGQITRTFHTENSQAFAAPSGIDVNECGFRMLTPDEVGAGMGFEDQYIVYGNNRQKVKQFGNAVNPVTARRITERLIASLQ